ncbi:hypothetical protein ACLHZ0_14620 [Aeromonas salmonicida]|uniref:hypothetical protein n=1 Tax=Aeromonas salmonicida TaxID=645 RepID=UPI001482B198|nr:hypothetical protein [Aeromonas salmonicida]
MAPGPVTPVFQIVNSAMSRSEEGIIDEFIIEAKVDDKGRLTQRWLACRCAQGSVLEQGEVDSVKPSWIRRRKKEKGVNPEGVLQTGLLLFSAACGATLLLAACNGS